MVHSALEHPEVGHSLMIDAAYTLYADEPHGWATTLAEALDARMMWPENLMPSGPCLCRNPTRPTVRVAVGSSRSIQREKRSPASTKPSP